MAGTLSRMIVVVGTPAWRATEPARPRRPRVPVALAAAEQGAAVELIGRAGDDPAGDALLLALAGAHVGHVALLRDPTRPTPIVAHAATEDLSVTDADATPWLRRHRRLRTGPSSSRRTSRSAFATSAPTT